jgi:hypothetical protein
MKKMGEYDKFLNQVRDKLILKKSINIVIKDFLSQSNSNSSSLGEIESEIKAKEKVFYELIDLLKAEGSSQEELDLLIETHKQKSSEALDEKLKKLSIIVSNLQLETTSNKLFVKDKKRDNSRKFIVEFVEPAKTEIKNNVVKSPQKISAKWHALHYLLESEAKGLKIPVNREGSFIKSEIEEIGRKRVGDKGQSFYRQVKDLVEIIVNKSDLIPYFGEDWKKQIIALSGNDLEIIDYIDKYY